MRRVRTGKPPTSAAFPAGAAAGNPHQLRSSPDALKTRGKARYLLRPSSPLAYPLPEHGRTWRSAVFIVKVQLARARSVPPPGQPATRPASARARRVDWLAKALSCGTPTDGALNTQVDWHASQQLAHRRLGLVRGEVALQKARARHLHAPWSLIMPTQRL